MSSLFTPLLTAGTLILFSCAAEAQAPQPDTSNPPPQTRSKQTISFSEAELEQLVAAIALYPDSFLAYVLIASTYPQEVVEASRWVDQNARLPIVWNLTDRRALIWEVRRWGGRASLHLLYLYAYSARGHITLSI